MRGFTERLIIVTLAWLFCLSPAAAQSNPQATADAAPPRGTLYRIGDGRHTLYLFGTLHVGLPDFFPLEPRITQALEQAPALALEIDPADEQASAAALQKHARLPAGQRFDQELDPDLAARTRQALTQAGLPPEAMQSFRPWLVAVTLVVKAYEQAGYDSSLAVDNTLARFMRQHGKPVLQLESADMQAGLFGAMSATDEVRFLDATLHDLADDQSRAQIDALVRAWRTADHAALTRALDELNDGSFVDRFTRTTLLDGRNPGLAGRIAGLLQSQDKVVAAVGALHLVGPGGIPALLRAQGLRVERLY